MWDPSFFKKLWARKLVQWTVAYLTGAFLVLQVAEQFYAAWDVSVSARRALWVILSGGLIIAITLAWFHGERGRQKLSTEEVLLVVAALLMTGAGVQLVRVRAPASVGEAPRGGPPGGGLPSVLVVAFENGSNEPDLDPVGEMVWHHVSAQLEDATVLSPGLFTLLGFGVRLPDRSLPVSLDEAETLGAAYLIWGSYYRVADSLELAGRVVDVATGASVGSAGPIRSPVSDPTAALDPLTDALIGSVATHVSPEVQIPREAGELAPGSYPSYAAYRSYLQGRRAWNAGNVPESAEHFGRAFAEDPSFHAAALHEAFARQQNFEPVAADSILRLMEPDLADLAPSNRWVFEFVRALVDVKTQEVYRLVRDRHARTPDYYWKVTLGFSALDAHRANEALEHFSVTAEGIDADTGASSFGNNAQFWRKYAEVFHTLDRHEEELAVAREGVKRYPKRAEVLGAEVFALAALGRVEEIEALIPRYRAAGHSLPWAEWRNDWVMAVGMCAYHGHTACAERLAEGFREYFGELPTQEQRSGRWRLAMALLQSGRHDEAEAVYSQIAEEAGGERPRELAWLEARRGDRAAAEALDLVYLDDPSLTDAYRAFWRSSLAAWMGERERALRLLREAFTEGLAWYPYARPYFPGHQPLWGDPDFEELLRPVD